MAFAGSGPASAPQFPPLPAGDFPSGSWCSRIVLLSLSPSSHLSFPSLSALPHTSPYCGLLRSAWERTSGRTFAALSPEQGLVCPLAGEGPQRWQLPHQHHSMCLHLQRKPLGEQIAVTKAYFRKIHTQGEGEGFPAG